jgi:hypothetical protein
VHSVVLCFCVPSCYPALHSGIVTVSVDTWQRQLACQHGAPDGILVHWAHREAVHMCMHTDAAGAVCSLAALILALGDHAPCQLHDENASDRCSNDAWPGGIRQLRELREGADRYVLRRSLLRSRECVGWGSWEGAFLQVWQCGEHGQ